MVRPLSGCDGSDGARIAPSGSLKVGLEVAEVRKRPPSYSSRSLLALLLLSFSFCLLAVKPGFALSTDEEDDGSRIRTRPE